MNRTLIIANKNTSSWSLRAWYALKKSGVPFEEKLIPFIAGQFKKNILQYSPAGKVPVLIEEDGQVIWDSLAIIEYTAESHPELWPGDKKARTEARCISAEMHSGFQNLRSAMPMKFAESGLHTEITKEVQLDINRIQSIWAYCRKKYADKGPWLFGRFCAADVMFAPVVSRFYSYGVTCEPVIKKYMEAVMADPYLQEWGKGAAEEVRQAQSGTD